MATKSKPASYSITERGGRVYAATPFSRTFITDAKRLTGARWHGNEKEWSWPAYQREAVTKLCRDMFGGSNEAPSDPRAQWAAPTGGWSAYDAASASNAPSSFERMFGCTLEALRAIFEGSSMARDMMVMGIISDAQEAMMSGDVEGARQMLNRAKWGLVEYLGVKPGAFTGSTPLAPNARQPIPVVRSLADDEARGEMDRSSEPEDFDPEMGF